MKVCICERTTIYQLIHICFEQLNTKPYVAEVGVLRGENASKLLYELKPSFMWLIDKWEKMNSNNLHPFSDYPFYIQNIEVYKEYFGGPLNEQETFDNLLNETKQKFIEFQNVKIIREDSIKSIDILKNDLQKINKKYLDFVYIDANHQYDYVLRDLMYWHKILSDNGLIQLNDCCFSDAGAKQNLGVLYAVTEFTKRTDFFPVLLTNTDWSDIVLAKRNSIISQKINDIINMSNIPYVEVPHQLLPSMKIVNGSQRSNISFLL